ncbi:MAG: phosphodiester glycosidase family protein [Candidatus Levybacteria bacterium]|nr:phosphodiester glycosidase family protein [Candidatus Levybacteria bacterium]
MPNGHLKKILFHFWYIAPIAVMVAVIVFLINLSVTAGSDFKSTKQKLDETKKELSSLKNVDQVKRNNDLESVIKSIEETYKKAVKVYEAIQDLRDQKQKTADYEKDLTSSLALLADRKYASASSLLTTLSKKIEDDAQKAAATTASSPSLSNAPANNTAPQSGFSTQKVNAGIGEYTVSLIAGDLSSTKVIVDTASDSDCRDNCPVLSLGDYVARNGAYAGVNGSYFCPASYPTCAGKTNSFDTLVMNKNKTYFNSDNNVYSNVPVAVFGNGFARFIGQSSGWGRDTGVDGVIANQPLLLSGGNIAFGGDGDPKKGSKGTRSFVGSKGSTVYIGVVYNATVAEVAYVLKTLGLENALNLDSGGSTALWSGGYKAGPGRNIPNAVLFVRR